MKNRESKTHALNELVTIQPGHPFRGKLPLSEKGQTFVVQFRHIVVGERLTDKHGAALDKATLTGRKEPDYLRPGDVLFMAKGTRNDTALVGDVPPNTVCTPNFYRIRLKPETDNLLPAFLNWQLNHLDAQRYFSMCSQGSAASSITKSQLEALPIIIPPLEAQQVMVNLADAATQEQGLLNQLIENRRRMVVAAGHHILHPEHKTEC
jgi:hypothetical protein